MCRGVARVLYIHYADVARAKAEVRTTSELERGRNIKRIIVRTAKIREPRERATRRWKCEKIFIFVLLAKLYITNGESSERYRCSATLKAQTRQYSKLLCPRAGYYTLLDVRLVITMIIVDGRYVFTNCSRFKRDVIVVSRSTPHLLFRPNRSNSTVIPPGSISRRNVGIPSNPRR